MSGFIARLDQKTGSRVLCGRRRCDGQLALIRRVPEKGWEVGLDGERPDGPFVCYVYMSPGWALRRGGYWELTPHALARIRRGQNPLNRSASAPTEWDEWIDEQDEGDVVRQPWLSPPLPTQVRCPSCGFLSLLDPEVLDVAVNGGTSRFRAPPWLPVGSLHDAR